MATGNEGGRPNIFGYATKELSQDAMICWLIDWADQDKRTCMDKDLRECGLQFVQALLNHKRDTQIGFAGNIETEIHRQDHGIDILARITDSTTESQYVLLIEDKTGTQDHGDQLKRYHDVVVGGETNLGSVDQNYVYPVYLKTGNQSRWHDRCIEATGNYKVFNRSDWLKVLGVYKGHDSILTDFKEHLQDLEDRTEIYTKWTRTQKGGNRDAWGGLYRCLESEFLVRGKHDSMGFMGWDYVPNKSGGFLGFWWWPVNDSEIYLQIESDHEWSKLCFKVDAGGKTAEEQKELKWRWHNSVMNAGGEQVVKPDRMRRGKSMTVAWWKNDWLAFGNDEKLDISGTVGNLIEAEGVLRKL